MDYHDVNPYDPSRKHRHGFCLGIWWGNESEQGKLLQSNVNRLGGWHRALVLVCRRIFDAGHKIDEL